MLVEGAEAGEVEAVSVEAVALVAEEAVSAEAVLQGDGRIIRIRGFKDSGVRVIRHRTGGYKYLRVKSLVKVLYSHLRLEIGK